MNYFFSFTIVVVVTNFFPHFCKVGRMVVHTQEDLAKFGYLLERKVEVFFFFLGRQCYSPMTCNNLCSNYGDFNLFLKISLLFTTKKPFVVLCYSNLVSTIYILIMAISIVFLKLLQLFTQKNPCIFATPIWFPTKVDVVS
jgi:hypothetical protein